MSQFDALRSTVNSLLESGKEKQAIDELAAWPPEKMLNEPPGNRHWYHKRSGLALASIGEPEQALRHLAQAHRIDPRDREVAVSYGQLLFEADRVDTAAGVIRTVLVHHKDDLDKGVLVRLTLYLGRYHRKRGEHNQARSLFDEALSLDSHDKEAFEEMLGLIDELPDASKAIRARKALLKRLRDPQSKARVLARQGDDLRHRADNPRSALWCYKEALAITPRSIGLLQRKASALAELGDINEAAEIMLALAEAPELQDAQEQLNVFERIYQLFKTSAPKDERLVSVTRRLLELQPDRLELFEELTTLRTQAEQWVELAEDYKRAIQHQQQNTSKTADMILPLMWRNLAELLDTHVDDGDNTIEVYAVAAKLRPKDVDVRRRLIDLCGDRTDKIEESIQACREVLEIIPGDIQSARTLAELLLRSGGHNEAFCVSQVLRVADSSTEVLDKSYERLQHKSLKMPTGVLSDKDRRQHLRLARQSYVLTSIMAIAKTVFQGLFSNDLKFHGVTEKDRINLKESLLFTRIFKAISKAMGWSEAPRVYRKSSMSLMINAALSQPAFIIGPDMLSGRSDREIAFIVGQQLALLRPEYYLTTVHQPNHLKSIVLVMVNQIDPSIEVTLTTDMLRLKREAEKRLTPQLRNPLIEVVATMIDSKADVNVDAWVESVADQANRTGLLFCDDLEVANECLSKSPGVLSTTETHHRRSRLQAWAMSTHRAELRKKLRLDGKD